MDIIDLSKETKGVAQAQIWYWVCHYALQLKLPRPWRRYRLPSTSSRQP